jgi:ketosteroid isomerase-like protein
VFARVPEEYDSFAVEIGQVVAEGDTVVMQGRYRAKVKASGAEIAPQIVHWWTVKDGKIATFQQHVDTLLLAKAVGGPA